MGRRPKLLPPASKGCGKVLFSVCQSTPRRGGGSQVQVQVGGGYTIQPWTGGVPGLRFSGGYPVSDFRGEGGPRSQIFRGEGGYPVSVKGKFLTPGLAWYMFRLEKNFLLREPSPLSKGKNFLHQIWLDTCSDWEKIFLLMDPPPPSKGKNFWHQIWLDTCSDWEKNFCRGSSPPRNSKKLLWLHGGRYASCVHAGGLSCFINFLKNPMKLKKFWSRGGHIGSAFLDPRL